MPKVAEKRDLVDENGQPVADYEGPVRDGHAVRKSFLMLDGGAAADRHAFVREKLGAAAIGKPAAFLDAAWRALQPDYKPSAAIASLPHMMPMSDAMRATAHAGIAAALEHAGRAASPTVGLDAAMGARDGARAAREDSLTDAWKGKDRQSRDALLAGASYSERMAIKSGARASDVKEADRTISNAELYRRQRAYQGAGSAA